MARTTVAEVNAILPETVADATVTAFIKTATELVTEVLGSDTTLTDALKEEIECWLTAHLIVATVQRSKMLVKAGGGPAPSVTFAGSFGTKLNSTTYGQQVLMLDTTGKFAKLGKRKANITAITSFEY